MNIDMFVPYIFVKILNEKKYFTHIHFFNISILNFFKNTPPPRKREKELQAGGSIVNLSGVSFPSSSAHLDSTRPLHTL